MSPQLKYETLWLDKIESMNNPTSKFAILWPAYEFTVMTYEHRQSDGLDVNPFERAIIGLVENGVVEIKKQAELLNLHEAFVAHLHTDLVNKGILNDGGHLKTKMLQLIGEETQAAFRIYQDPWDGKLWPRLSSAEYRKTMVTETVDGKVGLIVGTTGDPIQIRAFEVMPPQHMPVQPTSDDAAKAMKSWYQIEKNSRGISKKLSQRPIKLFPGTRQLVYLCCLNDQGETGRPVVNDPFGSPSWNFFVSRLTLIANEQPGLGRWLYYKDDRNSDDSELSDEMIIDSELGHLEERLIGGKGRQRLGDKSQSRLDVKALGHRAVDRIWATRTENYLPLLLDAQSDFVLLCKLATAMGFDSLGLTGATDFKEICESNSGTLRDRCSSLLLAFRPDAPGPLQHLVARCPNIFTLLESAESANPTRESDVGLIKAVWALLNTAEMLAEEIL